VNKVKQALVCESNEKMFLQEEDFAFAKGCFFGSIMGISMWIFIFGLVKWFMLLAAK